MLLGHTPEEIRIGMGLCMGPGDILIEKMVQTAGHQCLTPRRAFIPRLMDLISERVSRTRAIARTTPFQ